MDLPFRVTSDSLRRWLRLLSLLFLITWPSLGTADETSPEPARFVLELPTTVIRGTRTTFLRWTAYRADGSVAEEFDERVAILGARFVERAAQSNRFPFEDGVLELRTDPVAGTAVYIDQDLLELRAADRVLAVETVRRTAGWMTLLPPLLAVALAVYWRDAATALAVAVAAGALIVCNGHLLAAGEFAVGALVIEQLVPPDGDAFHITVILFTACLGGMIQLMFRSGGLGACVSSLAARIRSRVGGMLAVSSLGTVVFFDDYANTFLVGTTMRPLTDRLKISREKLAFLVDSTAAPIAGLAIVSTWVGVEVGYIGEAYRELGLSGDSYVVFLQTLPYRFYPLFALLFVFLIAWTGRDFGPMRNAERRVLRDESHGTLDGVEAPWANRDGGAILAIVPILVLILGLVGGLWLQGRTGLNAANEALSLIGEPLLPANMLNLLSHAQADRVLLYASLAASVAAAVGAVVSRTMSVQNASKAWLEGVERMLPALTVLVLAWGLSTVCNAQHLNTAAYLVEISDGWMTARWLPATAFVLSAVISFATGSSWSTMGILIPLVISVAHGLSNAPPQMAEEATLMPAAIGAVLAGAIFGDHCSPVSDTTVLSSAACDCDHVDHVRTQLPYAVSVGTVSLLCGYVPIGFGMPAWSGLVLGTVALIALVFYKGRVPQ